MYLSGWSLRCSLGLAKNTGCGQHGVLQEAILWHEMPCDITWKDASKEPNHVGQSVSWAARRLSKRKAIFGFHLFIVPLLRTCCIPSATLVVQSSGLLFSGRTESRLWWNILFISSKVVQAAGVEPCRSSGCVQLELVWPKGDV